jgi:hypothetical protein
LSFCWDADASPIAKGIAISDDEYNQGFFAHHPFVVVSKTPENWIQLEFGLFNARVAARNKIPLLMPLPHRFTANHNTASRARCRNVYFNA